MAKRRSNTGSPNSIARKCRLTDLHDWFESEMSAVEEQVIRRFVIDVVTHLDDLVRWPSEAMLLWPGCDRTSTYHEYPEAIRSLAVAAKIGRLDTRSNGPAISTFLIAGGERPKRFGSHNSWSVHHLYSGKFSYVGRQKRLHAVKDGKHFTQSAGLVAIHPIADQMCDEFPAFSWLLRALAYKRFGYDPDTVFSSKPHDKYGFVGKRPAIGARRILALVSQR